MVDAGRRAAAAAALVELARSDSYRDRVDAGVALARLVDVAGVLEVLRGLVLDPEDTAVTRATAEALARCGEAAALAVVASAIAGADDDHLTWIDAGVHDAVGLLARDRDAALGLCDHLASYDDAQVRCGVPALREVLEGVDPVLWPSD